MGQKTSNYLKIIDDNLKAFFSAKTQDAQERLGAESQEKCFSFPAFGMLCRVSEDGILLDDEQQTGPRGVVLSLYLLNASSGPLVPEPFKAFKELRNSMPYAGAFSTHTEHILAPHVMAINEKKRIIIKDMDGQDASLGDFSFFVRPLPKISLCFIFYLADEDFPSAATCLFSSNAQAHLPIDALADLGEYTARRILDIIG